MLSGSGFWTGDGTAPKLWIQQKMLQDGKPGHVLEFASRGDVPGLQKWFGLITLFCFSRDHSGASHGMQGVRFGESAGIGG